MHFREKKIFLTKKKKALAFVNLQAVIRQIAIYTHSNNHRDYVPSRCNYQKKQSTSNSYKL